MATSISAKLRIKPRNTLFTLNAPGDFKKGLGTLPAGVKLVESGTTYDQVHWFVTTKKQLDKEMSRVMKLLRPGVLVWVYYPKASSGMQTDLTRDKGWECLMAESDKLAWINLISFSNTWSVFGFRSKTEEDKKREARPKPQPEIVKWINPETREIKLPPDLVAAFEKNRKASDFFHKLSFTNKKEYVEWIVTAKKADTRNERIKGTIERLAREWKNPRNN